MNFLSISFPETEFWKHWDQDITLAPESSDLPIEVLWREKVGRAQVIFEERLEGNLWPSKTMISMCDAYEKKEKKEVDFFFFHLLLWASPIEERKYITIWWNRVKVTLRQYTRVIPLSYLECENSFTCINILVISFFLTIITLNSFLTYGGIQSTLSNTDFNFSVFEALSICPLLVIYSSMHKFFIC